MSDAAAVHILVVRHFITYILVFAALLAAESLVHIVARNEPPAGSRLNPMVLCPPAAVDVLCGLLGDPGKRLRGSLDGGHCGGDHLL